MDSTSSAQTTGTRSARHRAGDTGSYSTIRATNDPQRSRRSAGPRRSRTKRPITGTHRAPNTLPLEAWLEAAKNRPTTVLGTLVMAGLLVTAVPLAQPDGNDPGSLTAAAAATASAQAAQRGKSGSVGGQQQDAPQAQPIVDKTAKPTPEATVTKPGGLDPAATVPLGAGPGKSLLTTGGRQVALTFDDGPDPEQTPKILAMLDQYGVKATFCLVGSQAEKHPDLVRDIVAAGHSLCNHTFDHDLSIAKKSPSQIRADLKKTNAAIRAAVPDAPIPFFRAPGGNFNDRLVKVAHGIGMASLYWEVDPRDWEHLENETDAEHIKRVVATVKKQVKPGAIVLSHDFNQPDTIAAYKELLPWLAENFDLGIPSGTGETPTAPATPPTTEPAPAPSASETTAPVAPANAAAVEAPATQAPAGE
ncbi:polysaccharide deacetylase family protein [Actinoplanes regularis]|uniref:polysaccharide deacetylase family protein n=1 Tax=Actinoplanes regularis TaxID=52697 RepID=UPI002552293C|nr:polysaccharide deacetylase family protein [Actinoplanes regularis]